MNVITFVTRDFALACDDWLTEDTTNGYSRLEALCRLKQFKLVALVQGVRDGQPLTEQEEEAYRDIAVMIGFDLNVRGVAVERVPR